MKNLILARKAKKMTQKDVADILGIDRTTYGKYETGDSNPPTSTIAELCSIFQVSSDYLLGLSNDPTYPNKKSVSEDKRVAEFYEILGRLSSNGKDKALDIIRMVELSDKQNKL